MNMCVKNTFIKKFFSFKAKKKLGSIYIKYIHYIILDVNKKNYFIKR